MLYAPVLFASFYFALVNVLSIGRRILLPEAGVQIFLWQVAIAVGLGIVLVCTFLPSFARSRGPLGWLIPPETRSIGLLFTFVTAQAVLSIGIVLFFSGWVPLMSVIVLFLLLETNNFPIGEMSERVRGKHWQRKRRMFIVTFLALLNLCRADLQPKDIFILAGQSNMSGRGGSIVNNYTWNGLVPPECKSSPFIFRFNQNFTWEEAREPLHYNIDCTTTCGVGPGMPFANSLLKSQPPVVKNIGLVPCAAGGKPIVEWNRTGTLYRTLIQKAQASLEGGGHLRALLWYQGESDTSSLEDARSYRARFEEFVTNVRADLASPALPIVEVALASGKYYPYIQMVREAQLVITFRTCNVWMQWDRNWSLISCI